MMANRPESHSTKEITTQLTVKVASFADDRLDQLGELGRNKLQKEQVSDLYSRVNE